MLWDIDWTPCWNRDALARASVADVQALVRAVKAFAETGDGELVHLQGFESVLHVGPWALCLLLAPSVEVADPEVGSVDVRDVIYVLAARKIAGP